MKRPHKGILIYLYITIGCVVTAFGIDVFLASNKLAAGGVSGFATALNYLTGFGIGTITLLLNIPIFILGVWQEGKSFGVKTLYATIMLSVFLDLFGMVPVITRDLFLASVFGGMMSGAGLGLIFRQQATTGGTDIIAKVLHKRFSYLSVGKVLLVIDVMVVVFATLIFNDLQTGLYSAIALFVSSKVIDIILEGIDYAKIAFIISDHYEQISTAIVHEVNRGATIINGAGCYSKAPKNTIMCTLRNREIPHLKEVVWKHDKNAFMIVSDAREVLGEGFKNTN